MGLLAASPDPAAVTLGTASPPVSYTCDTNDPPVILDLTPAFDIIVRNCSGDTAEALVELLYSNPGGDRSDPGQYGTDSLHISFPLTGQEISTPILGMASELASVADVWITAYSLGSAPFEDRLLGKLYDTEYEGSPPGYMVPLTSDLKARLEAEIKFMAIESPQSPPGDEDCVFETQQVMVDNRGRENLFGTIQNKVLCTTDATVPKNCEMTGSSTANHAQEDVGMNLSPESFKMIIANDAISDPNNPGQLHDVCCDPGNNTVAVIECGKVMIDEIMVNGIRERLSAVLTLDAKDIRPIGSVLSPPDVKIGCAEIGEPFVSTISQQATIIKDEDDDGIHDGCDHVIMGQDPLKPLVRRRIRNLDFNDTGAIFNVLDTTTISDIQTDGTSLTFQSVSDPGVIETGTVEPTIPSSVAAGDK